MKRPRKAGEWVGLVVRLVRSMTTHHVAIPAGLEAVVTYSRGGFEITGRPCDLCGVAPRVTGVQPDDVEPVRRVVNEEACDNGPRRPRSVDNRLAINAAWPLCFVEAPNVDGVTHFGDLVSLWTLDRAGVFVDVGNSRVRLTVEEARDLARDLARAATAAEAGTVRS